jgi:H+-translocating NAD(P) transhydrogenase subunit alpha
MKIAVPTETHVGEARVAVSPDMVKAYLKKGATVAVQSGAGLGSNYSDADFKAAGASIVAGETVVKDADIVLTIRRPSDKLVKAMKSGAIVAGGLEPHGDRKMLEAFAKSGVTAFALELMPRITRAQSMDVLSSQANLAGYKAVIDAAANFSRAFPMMMTAAGTVAAAKVFIMGVGVAGLQAIATARRMGAIVSATDVRKATEEQVKSLGAKFIYVDLAEAATAAGYARELTAEEKAKQAELVSGHVKSQDIVITTALIPGRPAPTLITKEMVESMKPGSIIVDLAVERGGNCPLSKPDQIVEHKGVKIIGTLNLAGKLAGNAAPLFAKNIANFLDLVIQKDGTLKIDETDECISGTMIAKGGKLVHKIYGDAK